MKVVNTLTRVCFVTIVAAGTISLAQDAAATFKSKCQMCHGADGSGNAKMKVESFSLPDTVKMSDDDLIAEVTNGKGKMPAYKGKLSDDQIKGLVAYVRTLQKK